MGTQANFILPGVQRHQPARAHAQRLHRRSVDRDKAGGLSGYIQISAFFQTDADDAGIHLIKLPDSFRKLFA